MGYWQDKIVYIRDFAYPPSLRRIRMANENIGNAPAPTFAEYVLLRRAGIDDRVRVRGC